MTAPQAEQEKREPTNEQLCQRIINVACSHRVTQRPLSMLLQDAETVARALLKRLEAEASEDAADSKFWRSTHDLLEQTLPHVLPEHQWKANEVLLRLRGQAAEPKIRERLREMLRKNP